MNRNRQQRFRRVQESGNSARNMSIAALLEQPNIWSDWMDEEELNAVAWPRFAALMLREVSPAAMFSVLAPALREAAARADLAVLTEEFGPVSLPIRFDDWLVRRRRVKWSRFDDPVAVALHDLDLSPDVTWLANQAQELGPLSLLWLVMHGLQNAPYGWQDEQEVSSEDRWLIRLIYHQGAHNDPPAVVLSALYQSFHEAHPDMTSPVPDVLKQVSPTFVDACNGYAPEWLLAELEPRS